MRDLKNRTLISWVSLALLVLVAALGCSTDTPTEPRQTPQPPSNPSTTWNITVTSTATQLSTGSASTEVRISVRDANTGQAPPSGSTVAVTTNLGEFNALGSGVQSLALTLINGASSVFLFAGATPGTATIQAQLETSIGRLQINIVGGSSFFLERVVPNFGSPLGGEETDIFGAGFEAPVRVSFGGATAEVVSLTQNRIRVLTPRIDLPVGQTQTINISVTINVNGENQAVDTLASGYTYSYGSLNVPQILSVTPASGPNEGGTRVVINGDGFESPVQVLFGQGTSVNNFDGVEAEIESVSRTQVVVVSPPATAFGQNNLNQLVNILVRNQGSGLGAIAQLAFEYGVRVLVTAIAPSAGPFFGGQIVTIFGQGFDEPVAVGLAGFGQQILSVTGTEIVVRTVAIVTSDCQDVTGNALVTNIETGDGNTEGPDYTYNVLVHTPSVFSISPNSGTVSGGTIVTITGTGFRPPIQVFFGDNRPGNVLSVTDTEIVVEVPFFPERDLETEDCDDNMDDTQGERFIPTSVDITVVSLATTCNASFDQGFFYEPNDTSCRDDVGPIDPPDPPDPPLANFEFEQVGTTSEVLFNSTSTGDITSHVWDFDGLGTGTGPSTTFTFPGPGSYVVTLTVNGPGGSDAVGMVVTVI